jgi:hypothetical protein
MINRQGGSDPDLLSKPFLPAALVRKVREVLDQPSDPAGFVRAGGVGYVVA